NREAVAHQQQALGALSPCARDNDPRHRHGAGASPRDGMQEIGLVHPVGHSLVVGVLIPASSALFTISALCKKCAMLTRDESRGWEPRDEVDQQAKSKE